MLVKNLFLKYLEYLNFKSKIIQFESDKKLKPNNLEHLVVKLI